MTTTHPPATHGDLYVASILEYGEFVLVVGVFSSLALARENLIGEMRADLRSAELDDATASSFNRGASRAASLIEECAGDITKHVLNEGRASVTVASIGYNELAE